MLSQEYRPVASGENSVNSGHTVIHGLMHEADKTLCGAVEQLDSITMIGRFINCPACNAELKKIRQQRSREGNARHQERKRAEYDAAVTAYGTIDQDFIDGMRLRAMVLYEREENALGAMLQNTANRVQEYLNAKVGK